MTNEARRDQYESVLPAVCGEFWPVLKFRDECVAALRLVAFVII
jgi:hypothetical protein